MDCCLYNYNNPNCHVSKAWTKYNLNKINRGIVKIYDGNSFGDYQTKIYNGTTWEDYQPKVYEGTEWGDY